MAKFRDEAIGKICGRLCQVFGKQPEEITENTNIFTDLGAKSTQVSQLANYLEDEYDVQIAFVKLRKCETVKDIADYLEDLCDY